MAQHHKLSDLNARELRSPFAALNRFFHSLVFRERLVAAVLFEAVAREVLLEKQLNAVETRKNADYQIGRLIRWFGPLPITEITERVWIEYVLRERAAKERTFFDDRKYMRIILGVALRHGLIAAMPRLPIPDGPSDAGRELSRLELNLIRNAASKSVADAQGRADSFNQKSVDLLFQIDVAWKMGLRKRELLGLIWTQINWANRTIRFAPSQRKNRRALEIPINPDLFDEFSTRFARATCQNVFPSPTRPGYPLGSNKTAWNRCLLEVNVDCRWHDLRHTCASWMLRAGVPRHVVKAYLGISDVVLDRIYAHLDLDDLRSAALVMTDAAKPVELEDLRRAAAVMSA